MNEHTRWIIGAFVATIVAVPFPAMADQTHCSKTPEAAPCTMDTISRVIVTLQGTAEKLGISDTFFERLIRMRLRNDLSMLKHDTMSVYDIINKFPKEQRLEQLRKRGTVHCRIWTVGNSQPIAFYMHCKLDPLFKYSSINDTITQDMLGYTTGQHLSSDVDKGIREIIADISSQFLRLKHE